MKSSTIPQSGTSEDNSLHWSQQKEEAAGYWQLKLLHILFLIFPMFVLHIIAFPVGFFYFLFSKRGRTESSRFLQRIAEFVEDPKLAKKCRSRTGPLRHIISFSLSMTEKIQAWGGKFSFNDICFQDDDINDLIEKLEEGKGAFLLISHLGNSMLLQGLLNMGKTGVSRKIPVTAIVDMKVNAHFSRLLNELNPSSSIDIIGAEEVGPHTAVLFEERIAAGGLVLTALDRTPLDGRNIQLEFLGKEASFPAGLFYLIALVKAPAYFVFGMRQKDLTIKPKYNMHVHKNHFTFDCRRSERFKQCSLFAQYYLELLEKYCKKHPFQWYNFFDFWQKGN